MTLITHVRIIYRTNAWLDMAGMLEKSVSLALYIYSTTRRTAGGMHWRGRHAMEGEMWAWVGVGG